MLCLVRTVVLVLGILTALVGCDSQDNRLQRWHAPFVDPPALLSNSILAIHQSPEGVLWFGTFDGGVSRFEPATGQWQTFTTKEGLGHNSVLAIHQSPEGVLWFGTSGGGVNLVWLSGKKPGHFGAVVNLKIADYTATLVVTDQTTISTRALGLLFWKMTEAGSRAKLVESLEPIEVLSAGPEGSVWAGERLGGLSLCRADGCSLRLTEAQGLPSMHVRALAPVNRTGTAVWAGTDGGAARVALTANMLHIEQTVDYRDGLPTGPVVALAAQEDGSVFLAYNALAAKWFSDSDFAQRRASSRVYFIPVTGSPQQPLWFYRGEERITTVDIRALALSGTTLWAGTSAGLFKAEHAAGSNARLALVATSNSPQVPIRQLKVHPTTGDLWLIADAQEDVPARLIGYNPERGVSMTLGAAQGLPSGLPLHDFAFTGDGQLVVLTGSLLFKGFIRVSGPGWTSYLSLALVVLLASGSVAWLSVFYHPLVRELRRQPEKLQQFSFPQIVVALKRLQRARALHEVRQRLDLSPQRLDLLKTLAAGDSLTAVATLLGMEKAADSKVQDLHQGLQLLQMQVPYPEALQRQPLPLIGVDPEAIPTDAEATCRMVIQETLDHLRLPFELPFLMLCRNAEKGRHLLPGDRVALIIDEPVLRELLFAPQPSQTLAGLLLTRGLLALSPYSIQGEVKNPHMFYGRERDLREIVQAATPQFLLVGPRRIGKSSLLRRLQDELPRQRPALLVLSVDLLGISEPTQFAQLLTRRLRRPPVSASVVQNVAAYTDDLLRSHFTEVG